MTPLVAVVSSSGVLQAILQSHLKKTLSVNLIEFPSWKNARPKLASSTVTAVILDEALSSKSPPSIHIKRLDRPNSKPRSIPKPASLSGGALAHFLEQVTQELRVLLRSGGAKSPAPGGNAPSHILIASSTGGPEALRILLKSWPKNCPPTAVVQHMPLGYTKSFAEGLNTAVPPTVQEGREGELLAAGKVLIAPALDRHTIVVSSSQGPKLAFEDGPMLHHQRPAADRLLDSGAKLLGKRVLGIVLTGMGKDGAKGLLEIRRHGGMTIGQDRASSVVYGMPKAAHEIGAVIEQLPLEKIGPRIAGML